MASNIVEVELKLNNPDFRRLIKMLDDDIGTINKRIDAIEAKISTPLSEDIHTPEPPEIHSREIEQTKRKKR